MAQRAGQLCRADGSRVWLVADGKLQAMTSYGPAYAAMSDVEVLPISRRSIGGRAVLERRPVHVEDVLPLLTADGLAANQELFAWLNQRLRGLQVRTGS